MSWSWSSSKKKQFDTQFKKLNRQIYAQIQEHLDAKKKAKQKKDVQVFKLGEDMTQFFNKNWQYFSTQSTSKNALDIPLLSMLFLDCISLQIYNPESFQPMQAQITVQTIYKQLQAGPLYNLFAAIVYQTMAPNLQTLYQRMPTLYANYAKGLRYQGQGELKASQYIIEIIRATNYKQFITLPFKNRMMVWPVQMRLQQIIAFVSNCLILFLSKKQNFYPTFVTSQNIMSQIIQQVYKIQIFNLYQGYTGFMDNVKGQLMRMIMSHQIFYIRNMIACLYTLQIKSSLTLQVERKEVMTKQQAADDPKDLSNIYTAQKQTLVQLVNTFARFCQFQVNNFLLTKIQRTAGSTLWNEDQQFYQLQRKIAGTIKTKISRMPPPSNSEEYSYSFLDLQIQQIKNKEQMQKTRKQKKSLLQQYSNQLKKRYKQKSKMAFLYQAQEMIKKLSYHIEYNRKIRQNYKQIELKNKLKYNQLSIYLNQIMVQMHQPIISNTMNSFITLQTLSTVPAKMSNLIRSQKRSQKQTAGIAYWTNRTNNNIFLQQYCRSFNTTFFQVSSSKYFFMTPQQILKQMVTFYNQTMQTQMLIGQQYVRSLQYSVQTNKIKVIPFQNAHEPNQILVKMASTSASAKLLIMKYFRQITSLIMQLKKSNLPLQLRNIKYARAIYQHLLQKVTSKFEGFQVDVKQLKADPILKSLSSNQKFDRTMKTRPSWLDKGQFDAQVTYSQVLSLLQNMYINIDAVWGDRGSKQAQKIVTDIPLYRQNTKGDTYIKMHRPGYSYVLDQVSQKSYDTMSISFLQSKLKYFYQTGAFLHQQQILQTRRQIDKAKKMLGKIQKVKSLQNVLQKLEDAISIKQKNVQYIWDSKKKKINLSPVTTIQQMEQRAKVFKDQYLKMKSELDIQKNSDMLNYSAQLQKRLQDLRLQQQINITKSINFQKEIKKLKQKYSQLQVQKQNQKNAHQKKLNQLSKKLTQYDNQDMQMQHQFSYSQVEQILKKVQNKFMLFGQKGLSEFFKKKDGDDFQNSLFQLVQTFGLTQQQRYNNREVLNNIIQNQRSQKTKIPFNITDRQSFVDQKVLRNFVQYLLSTMKTSGIYEKYVQLKRKQHKLDSVRQLIKLQIQKASTEDKKLQLNKRDKSILLQIDRIKQQYVKIKQKIKNFIMRIKTNYSFKVKNDIQIKQNKSFRNQLSNLILTSFKTKGSGGEQSYDNYNQIHSALINQFNTLSKQISKKIGVQNFLYKQSNQFLEKNIPQQLKQLLKRQPNKDQIVQIYLNLQKQYNQQTQLHTRKDKQHQIYQERAECFIKKIINFCVIINSFIHAVQLTKTVQDELQNPEAKMVIKAVHSFLQFFKQNFKDVFHTFEQCLVAKLPTKMHQIIKKSLQIQKSTIGLPDNLKHKIQQLQKSYDRHILQKNLLNI